MPEPESDYVVASFTYGTYPSADGSPATFTPEFMRELERNTNFLIDRKILTPPVEYDWIDSENKYHHGGMSAIDPSERTDAHGQIGKVEFKNRALHLHYVKTSDKLRKDIDAGRRIRTSPVYVKNYWYNDADGVRRNVGPAIVGTTVLGAKRPALRNPLIVPLQDLPKRWGEQVHPAEAWQAIEELRTTGLIAQTFEDDRFMFSEVDVQPRETSEEKTTMTDVEKAEMKEAIATAVANATKALQDQLAIQAQKFTEQDTAFKAELAKFSEAAQIKADTKAFCETYAADRAAKKIPVPPLFAEHMETVLNHRDLTSADLRKEIKALCESANGAVPPTGKAGEQDDKTKGKSNDDDEPKALAEARLRHWANLADPANQEVVDAAIVALGEHQPDLFKNAKTEDQRQDITRDYIARRDGGAAHLTN